VQKNKHKRTRFLANGFFILSVGLSAQATAMWKCRLQLSAGPLIVGAAVPDEMDIWIPEGATLAAFKTFKNSLPVELQNSRELADLIEHSPALKHAFTIYISSLDPNAGNVKELSPLLIANNLSRILFNEEQPRSQGADEIGRFLRDTQMRAFASYGPGELPLISPDKRIKIWAASIEKELRSRWYDRTDDETVYRWILADNSPDIKARLWGASIEAPEDTILKHVGHLPSIQKLIIANRESPLFKNGEIFRDNFRVALETFEAEQLSSLKAKFHLMFSLKDKGAMDDVNLLLEPFLKPREDADFQNPGYAKEHRDVLQRLFNSSHFFDAFLEFQESYVTACHALIELSRNPKLTTHERRKISDLAQERLITYSVDLVSMGLNFHPPHEYRYRPRLLEMQLLNGRLEREVIPVGSILDFGQVNPPSSGLIITP